MKVCPPEWALTGAHGGLHCPEDVVVGRMCLSLVSGFVADLLRGISDVLFALEMPQELGERANCVL